MIFNLMKPVPVQTATMYSYNGTVLPALPTWDKETYPYAMVNVFGWLYVMREPCTNAPSSFLPSFDFPSQYMKSSIGVYGTYVEWEQLEGGTTSTYEVIWSNFEILKQDGSVYLSASDPVPVTLPITMFDGKTATNEIKIECGYKVGDRVEITIDGNTAIYTATSTETTDEIYKGVVIGNLGLKGGVDDGGEILLHNPNIIGGKWYTNIYFKDSETHNLTIKLIGVN